MTTDTLMLARQPLHNVVALLEDLPAKHFETDQPLLLRRDQIASSRVARSPVGRVTVS